MAETQRPLKIAVALVVIVAALTYLFVWGLRPAAADPLAGELARLQAAALAQGLAQAGLQGATVVVHDGNQPLLLAAVEQELATRKWPMTAIALSPDETASGGAEGSASDPDQTLVAALDDKLAAHADAPGLIFLGALPSRPERLKALHDKKRMVAAFTGPTPGALEAIAKGQFDLILARNPRRDAVPASAKAAEVFAQTMVTITPANVAQYQRR